MVCFHLPSTLIIFSVCYKHLCIPKDSTPVSFQIYCVFLQYRFDDASLLIIKCPSKSCVSFLKIFLLKFLSRAMCFIPTYMMTLYIWYTQWFLSFLTDLYNHASSVLYINTCISCYLVFKILMEQSLVCAC
jgi:hypothetical protein